MKRILALLLTLLLLSAVPAFAMGDSEPVEGATPMGPFDFTDDILEDGTLIYYFQDLALRLPADWNGKLLVVPGEDGSGVSFYQKDSYEKYLEDGIEGGGFLFSLGASVNNSFEELPSFEYLGFSERSMMNYYLQTPSDYPAYLQDEDIRAEYDEMLARTDFIMENAELYPAD